PQNASAREPSGLLTEEPVDPEHQEQRPQNASAREPSGLLTEEPVDPEHQEQRPQNASAREPSGLLTEEPEDEQNDDGAEEGDEEEFDNEEDSLENEHAPYQTQIATRVATPPRELVRQELELQFLLSAAQQKGLQTQSQRLNQALDFQVHHDPQPFSPAPKTPVKPSPARRSKTRATIKHDFTLTEKSLEWQLMEACLELLDKPVKAKIDESDDPAGKTVNSVKLNYAKHFNFLVTKDQNRAEKLLQRLIQIRTEKPRPKLSTADYIYIIAGNPNDFAFRNNLSALKSNLTVISDGSDSDSVKKLQIKTSDNRTAILYAYNFIEEGINCKFDAVIPLSTFLTSKDFLQKTLRDQSGRTVLHWAAIGGSFSMLDTLATGLNTLRRNLPTLTDSFPQFSSTDHRNNSVAHEIARSELYQIRVNTSATHELIVQRSHLRFNHNASYDIIELTRDNLDSLTSDEHIDFFSTRNQDGDLPFQLVVSHNFTALLGILLNDPNAPILNIDRDLHGTNGSSTNVSILHYAAMCPEVLWTTASIIIQQKPRLVHTPDAQGYMPLHYASAACNVPTQLLLLAKGARPSAKSQTGDSPLTLALSAYTFDDETLDSTGKIPLHMSTLIRGFNDIAERRLTKCEHEPLDYNSRYITSDELDSLDEILGNEAIMNLFTPAEKQRLQLASLQRLYENLSKEKYIRRPVSEEKEHSKVATRMREYALLPVAIFQARGVEFGEKEKAAAYYNPRGLQVIRSSQYYSAFFTSKAFPIPEKQKKEFLIEYGFEKNSDIKLEDINQTLVEATEGFKVLLIRSISAWDQPWVKTVPQRTNGHRIPSWGQWWNDRFGDTTYKNIAIKILDKVEVLLKKVEYVKTQLDARTMHENTAAELNSKYKAELLTLIDDALRKADKQMQHVDKSTSDPALSDFRARCMVAKVIATKVDIVSATVARELNF
ncbi:MAG: hypothetical protein K2X50_10040, partial [Gammaproteobacteria bacterium]|nr:hypothetical protein [Gammaproteobacteria bacterium]